MSNLFPSLVARISIAMFAVVLLSMSAIIYYWAFVVAPALKANEQSEVELLISPYTHNYKQYSNSQKLCVQNIAGQYSCQQRTENVFLIIRKFYVHMVSRAKHVMIFTKILCPPVTKIHGLTLGNHSHTQVIPGELMP